MRINHNRDADENDSIARQFNLVRDTLSRFSPKEAIYEYELKQKTIP